MNNIESTGYEYKFKHTFQIKESVVVPTIMIQKWV